MHSHLHHLVAPSACSARIHTRQRDADRLPPACGQDLASTAGEPPSGLQTAMSPSSDAVSVHLHHAGLPRRLPTFHPFVVYSPAVFCACPPLLSSPFLVLFKSLGPLRRKLPLRCLPFACAAVGRGDLTLCSSPSLWSGHRGVSESVRAGRLPGHVAGAAKAVERGVAASHLPPSPPAAVASPAHWSPPPPLSGARRLVASRTAALTGEAVPLTELLHRWSAVTVFPLTPPDHPPPLCPTSPARSPASVPRRGNDWSLVPEFQRVSVTGRPDYSAQMRLGLRAAPVGEKGAQGTGLSGQGYFLLTPLALDDGGRTTVLLNRGWVERRTSDSALLEEKSGVRGAAVLRTQRPPPPPLR